jgi:hypothetical protein
MDREFMEKRLLDSLDGFKGSKKEMGYSKNLFSDLSTNSKIKK